MVSIDQVRVGDELLSVDESSGAMSYSPVVAVPHAHNTLATDFVHLSTDSGRDLKLTSSHLLPFVSSCKTSTSTAAASTLGQASAVKVGDCLVTEDGVDRVDSIDLVPGKGVYTVVVINAYIIVNGIVASPFAINHALGHWYYNLHRTVYRYFPAIWSVSVLASDVHSKISETIMSFTTTVV